MATKEEIDKKVTSLEENLMEIARKTFDQHDMLLKLCGELRQEVNALKGTVEVLKREAQRVQSQSQTRGNISR